MGYLFLTLFSILSLSIAIVLYAKYKKISGKYITLSNSISKNYIKNSYILQNAVLKAYETSKEEHNLFESREFKILLDTLKGK